MRKLAVAAVVALVLSACGGGGASDGNGEAGGGPGAGEHEHGAPAGAGTPASSDDHSGHGDHAAAADCTPQGTSLSITASGTAFSTDCLAAPAGQPVTIAFENKDSAAHNLAVLESHTATDVLFRGDIVMGPKTVEYSVPALEAGTYVFHCEVHPDKMLGNFVVK